MMSCIEEVQAQPQTRGASVFLTPEMEVGSVWGMFVGVSNYENDDLELTHADKDTEKFYHFFLTHFKEKVPSAQFKMLKNENALREKILRIMKEVLSQAKPEDLVILFFAMHGQLTPKGDKLFSNT